MAPAAHVHVRTWFDQHVAGGHDVGNRGLSGVLPGQPQGDRDVVGNGAEGDRQQTMETEQELGATIIVSWTY